MKDLKRMAKVFSEWIKEDSKWLEHEINFVADGSHVSGVRTYNHIQDTLDVSKKNYGKRGSSLIAWLGIQSIVDLFHYDNINHNQALSIWKHLSDDDKEAYNAMIKAELELQAELMEEQHHV